MVDHGTLRAVSESDSYNKQKQTRTNFESGPSGASRLGFATRGLRVRKERDSPVVLLKNQQNGSEGETFTAVLFSSVADMDQTATKN